MSARRFISWPSGPEMRAVNRLPRGTVYLSDASESKGGIDDDTSYRPAGKRDFSAMHNIPYDYKHGRAVWEWINGNVPGGAGRIWYPEPCSYWRENVRCGPTGDGANKAFPIPIRDASIGPYVYVDGELQETAIIEVSANLLTDDQAAITSTLSGLSATGLSVITDTYEHRYYYGPGLRIDPIGTVSGFGWQTDLRPCPPSWPVTGVFWAIGPTGLDVRVRIRFYDALEALISTSLGSTTPLITGTWQPVSHTVSAPSNTAFVRISGLCATTTAQSWWCDCRGAMLLENPWWWLPSEAPMSALIDPPAEFAVPTASGTGIWSYLCKPTGDRIGDEVGPQGHVMASLDLQEVWEKEGTW